ncbi:hypothetical protein LG3211_5271 [Lysobacter gummosus]|nr:hypothetical protein LG3211_5271 [Lysobacter gummosus]
MRTLLAHAGPLTLAASVPDRRIVECVPRARWRQCRNLRCSPMSRAGRNSGGCHVASDMRDASHYSGGLRPLDCPQPASNLVHALALRAPERRRDRGDAAGAPQYYRLRTGSEPEPGSAVIGKRLNTSVIVVRQCADMT